MAPLWGVLVALVALGEGRGARGPPHVTPEFGEGATRPEVENGPGGGGAGAPPRGGSGNFGGSPGGLWGSLGALGAAYLGLGAAAATAMHLGHRALRNRKRRRSPARRFFRASPPEPQNPYGNLPGPRPAPSSPLPPPQDEDPESDSASYVNMEGVALS